FARATDDYTVTLDYISGATANGTDASGNPIMGFKWWDFAFPRLVTSGANAIPEFVAATNGGVDFGGTVGTLTASGVSDATWADPANPGRRARGRHARRGLRRAAGRLAQGRRARVLYGHAAEALTQRADSGSDREAGRLGPRWPGHREYHPAMPADGSNELRSIARRAMLE